MKLVRLSLALCLCALAIPAAAQAETLTSPVGAAIPIPNGATNPLGTLKVEGADGGIADIDVNMALTHLHPDDLDIALVSPGGEAQILMSDVCGSTDLFSVSFTFDQDAPATIPDGAGCPETGAIRGKATNATSAAGSESAWTAPGAPAGLVSADLEAFQGQNPNGTWKLYAADDNGNGTGRIDTWSLTITTSAGEVAIPAGPATSGTSGPYPMTKSFDLDGRVITDLDLRITGFNHLRTRDVDMLLQGPSGEAVMVMSDACGNGALSNQNWLFDDESNFGLTENQASGCTPTLQKPSVFGEAETMPAPAPAGPYSSSLATFDNLGGSAPWSLYVSDDTDGETGYIDSWEIVTATRPASATGFTATTASVAEGQSAQLTVNRDAPATGLATVDVAVTDGDTNASDFGSPLPTRITFAPGETSKSIEIPVNSDLEGEVSEIFYVALANPTNDAALADATSFATVTIAQSNSDNRFQVGDVTRKKNGSARIEVTVPVAGQLSTDEAGPKDLLKETQFYAEKPGTYKLKVKPAPKAKDKLNDGRKVKLTTQISYLPDGGEANTEETKVTLKKK